MQALEKLSLKEKIALCSGADNWNTKAFPKAGIPSVFLCDGPHGLRIENVRAGSVNLKDSAEAVCFPAACLTASSWDPALLRTLGAAIAEEMEAEGVSVILGPGSISNAIRSAAGILNISARIRTLPEHWRRRGFAGRSPRARPPASNILRPTTRKRCAWPATVLSICAPCGKFILPPLSLRSKRESPKR